MIRTKNITEEKIAPTPAEEPAAPVAVSSGVRPGRKKSPTSLESQKPWEAEGVSRTTWYGRQKVRKACEAVLRKKAEPSDWQM
jgi:hypothetical protein